MSGTRGRPPATSGHESSRRIRDAAVRLFYSNGFAAASVRQIAHACNLTPGAIYNHFGSKYEILASIVTCALDEADRDITAAIASARGGPRERMRAALVAFVLRQARYPEAARVSDRDYVFLLEPKLGEVVTRRRAIRSIFERLIQDGIDLGIMTVPAVPRGRTELVIRVTAMSLINMSVMVGEWYRTGGGAVRAGRQRAPCGPRATAARRPEKRPDRAPGSEAALEFAADREGR